MRAPVLGLAGVVAVACGAGDPSAKRDQNPHTPNAGTIVDGVFDDAGSSRASAACVTTSAQALPATLPVDIIWVVDQSGSMGQETDYVETQINRFANLIDQSHIDYRVVMIASTDSSQGICVPPPLSTGDCGDGPRFKRINTFVGSHDALSIAIAQYPAYRDFLRPDAVKHFVFVSDDNPTDPPIDSAAAFTTAITNAEPAGMFAFRRVHAIYAYGSIPYVGCVGFFGIGAAIGTIYEELVAQTRGARGEICSGDWTPVFDAISSSIVTSTKVDCSYAMPSVDAGTVDKGRVNVSYLAGGVAPGTLVPHVASEPDCAGGSTPGGWYFDDENAPERVILCPQTCATAQSDPAARIDLQFGCTTVAKAR